MFERESTAILDAVAGSDNIKYLAMGDEEITLTLRDLSSLKIDNLAKVDGIESITLDNDQLSLKIQNNRQEIYEKLEELMQATDDVEQVEEKKESVFNKVVAAITASLSPVVPIMAGAGLGKVIVLVLNLTGVLSETDSLYIFLKFIFDTSYYFLPGYVGFSAAKVFGANRYLGAFMGLMTVHPTWVGLVEAGTKVNFLGFNIPLIEYDTTLVSALLTVWMMSYIERFFRKYIPDMIKVFGVPLMTMLVTAPLTFMVFGPVGDFVSHIIADGSVWLYDNVGFIAIPLLAAAYPWMVSIGVHKSLSPISITLVAEQGYDPIIRVVALCANISQAAAGLAVGLKAKNKELKSLAYSTGFTALLGGTTSPVMYGVNLPLKKPMYASMAGALAGGIFASLMKMKAFIYVTPALLSLPMWVSKEESYLLEAIITILIVTVVTIAVQFILGFDESDYKVKD
ncbi:PTS beta-glucoside transporter subunit IIABC [Aerococcus urinaehominis]|uniref:PTS beta-glucoside transporter subunit IIABC n=1 Tax=Aerococcus urinaehominis TaxID=128944 RepID=A0A120IB35_9LACT|nr:PTS transporter subunit EIIC [Aerococcus urinaehominis]AMB99983.1 PTS beta-glucoside transporter subunit IIABC [Aerococcus urinaehominis]SDM45651.1 PTS system beta-glucoside-specific IIA component, Glc family (TC 4.A.1.2.5)/PTS system beta-glucoside-specific IIB component, Glc family (TC 4.A.1.2.5)/PTS system beta-glucoside-specific IIC component, Glc family (TC 4.A.1.2.5) [Aerococcus urinaehominis]